ncbi:MAG: hypothetical protein GF346_00010 [Candidatus Eisenbacteria bacterium]|nr:hypothetical protein [Candidatus Latescibacterota bacterium]MBD3300815.1 hypothetical protein [Candidatus Eisenbacteria bacterium]
MIQAGFGDYVKLVFTSTLLQLGGVLGIFFVFGTILFLLERQTTGLYARTVGWRGILFTAWLGTPVHEAGHAVFCLLFRHRILAFQPFQPDRRSGVLGYVTHAWNQSSIYQNVGNLFIGAGPLISGSLALYGLLHLLVPNGQSIFGAIHGSMSSLAPGGNILAKGIVVVSAGGNALLGLLSPQNLVDWRFWVFLYLAGCIATHLAPSPSDLTGVWSGLAWLTGIVLAANVVLLLVGVNATAHVTRLTRSLAGLVSMLLLSVVLSFLHLLAASVVFSVYGRLRGRRSYNPIA